MENLSQNFIVAHKFTAEWEGGISDHPADRGGVTAYGASIEFVKDLASTASGKSFLQGIGVALPITRAVILKLTPGQVAQMFNYKFWQPHGLDRLPLRPAGLIYDASVNHGARAGARLAQRGYNKLAGNGEKLAEDGIVGPKTVGALAAGADALVKAIIQARRDYYHAIVAGRPSQKVFLKGWLNRADALERRALGSWQ